ncbi:MAG: Rieske 2Fe-2S domain-containing protein [Pseudonocardiales bacterium]|nr:Rieske 2Fe-2S domain-containing protein [Pseudonocardiales bacterium]
MWASSQSIDAYRDPWQDRGGPLADGLIDGQQVICPLHNHAFRLLDGQCTTGISPVRAYHVNVENGELVLRLDATQ